MNITLHHHIRLTDGVYVYRLPSLIISHCGVRIQPRSCEKVATDLGLGGVFHRVLWFPLPVTIG